MDIRGNEVRVNQVIRRLADDASVYVLSQNLDRFHKDRNIRIATGLTMSSLGYVFGPQLHERIKTLKDKMLDEATRQKAIYGAAGAIAGSVAAYKFGPKLLDITSLPRNARPGRAQRPGTPLEKRIDDGTNNALYLVGEDGKPNVALTMAGVAWLGYSVFIEKMTPEEKERQAWGLGGFAVGYTLGPAAARKIGQLIIPQSAADNAVEIYRRGIAAGGGLVGAVLAYQNADKIGRVLSRR